MASLKFIASQARSIQQHKSLEINPLKPKDPYRGLSHR